MPTAQTTTAEPSSAAEAAEALRAAAVAGQRVRIAGNGSKLGWGRPIAPPDVELRTTGLDRIVAHNAGDFTAIVQPGVPLAATAGAAWRRRGRCSPSTRRTPRPRWAAWSPPRTPGRCATRFFAARDLVIGIQVALTDGSVARAGGTVIKNVAGYDLAKLFTGSTGTLGAITELAVRLHPLPAATATAIGASDDPAALGAAARAIAARPLEADSVDVRWEDDEGALLVRVSGDTAAARGAQIVELLAEAGLATRVEEDDDALWAAQRDAQRSAAGVVARVAAGQADLQAVLEAARSVGATVVGRAGLGLSWLRMEDVTDPALAAERVRDLRARLAPSPVVVLDAPAAVRDAVDPWGPVEAAHLALLRAVKARFDPAGALAAGLFVGGI